MRNGGVLTPEEQAKWDKLETTIKKIREASVRWKDKLKSGVDNFGKQSAPIVGMESRPVAMEPIGPTATVTHQQGWLAGGIQKIRESMATGLEATKAKLGYLPDPVSAVNARLPMEALNMIGSRVITGPQDEIADASQRTALATEDMSEKLDKLILAIEQGGGAF